MKWVVWGANMMAAEMAGHIEVAVAAGVHTFDHADIYGGYTTEAAFGEAFALADVRREEVEFISKCGICYPPEGTPNAVKRYDYSAAHIRRSAENSLRNLQTSYLDLFLLHRPALCWTLEGRWMSLSVCKAREKSVRGVSPTSHHRNWPWFQPAASRHGIKSNAH